MIFDDKTRTDLTKRGRTESRFSFLNRSGREEVETLRRRLEDLILDYPDQQELIARFRSGDDNHFNSAEFELLLFTLLKKKGFKLHPHPQMSNDSTACPDFLVACESGETFYLEAVLATERSDDATLNQLTRSVLDYLDAEPHKSFSISVDISGRPKSQPPLKRIRRYVLDWLDSLDPDSILEKCDTLGDDAVPENEFQHEDLIINMRAIPIEPNQRTKTHSFIVLEYGGVGPIDSQTSITKAVRKKGGKYGKLNIPMVIAVNVLGEIHDEDDEVNALFGSPFARFSVKDGALQQKQLRARDGAWIGNEGSKYTRIGGVWIFNNLSVRREQIAEHTLYLNPWAIHDVPNDLRQFPHAEVLENKLIRRKGTATE